MMRRRKRASRAKAEARSALIVGALVAALPVTAVMLRALGLPFDLAIPRWGGLLGLVAVSAGGGLLGTCFLLFLLQRDGMPAPTGPQGAIEAGGLYRYSRNPAMLGFCLALVGWTLFRRAPDALALALCVCCLAHVVVIWEERQLRRRFGPSFDDYCGQVPRWFPRPTIALRKPASSPLE
ncbi:methyltransferase family protein [Consotaella salsifontis]|uniref:Protein-S-isoprenylcysteine O-methyltransferase Ste14 n=1 Tax=Consotaella salsifontis TaxID=1365950 RepID=A0A1T4PW70_9HYPH|nr:isoprenylcysteine carboxylmethyltransferase family protein [Consotaella salsifontis]SJZ95800.1 Protein-S-isoprenylcysteine O-methyltransferase Ste14 [Consotaella salsifontis]